MRVKQVSFLPLGEEAVLGGIMIHEGENVRIICGCCGGVYEAEDVEIYEEFEDWVNIDEEIREG